MTLSFLALDGTVENEFGVLIFLFSLIETKQPDWFLMLRYTSPKQGVYTGVYHIHTIRNTYIFSIV